MSFTKEENIITQSQGISFILQHIHPYTIKWIPVDKTVKGTDGASLIIISSPVSNIFEKEILPLGLKDRLNPPDLARDVEMNFEWHFSKTPPE